MSGIFPSDRTQARFAKYHHDNPHVYAKLVEFARQVKTTGKQRYSIWALFQRLRWHYEFDVKTSDRFKISNDYTSRYARLIMLQENDLNSFFNIKQLKANRFQAAAA